MSGRGGRGRGGGRGGGDHGGGRRGGGGEGHSERGRGRGRGRSGGEEVKQRMPQGGAPPPPTVGLSDLNRGVDCLHISSSTGSSSSAAPCASSISEVGSSPTTCATTALSVPLAAEEQNVLPTSTKGLNPPQRPGFGSVGVKCVVNANHFLVALKKPNLDLFHYDVSIVPEVTSRRVNRMVIEKLVKDYRQSYLGGLNMAYDGRKNIFTAGSLPFESKEFVIKLDNEGDSKRDREFKVAIRLAAKLDFYHLIAFLQRKQLDAPHELITLLDVVLRASPSMRHVSVGRSFFSCDFGDPSKLGGGVECWRGYYQSLRPTQMGLSLNIDLSATSFFEALPVINFIGANLGMRYSSKPMRDADRVKVRRALRGLKVVLTHLKDRQIKRRITGITSLPTKSLTFIGPEGLEKSVPQYFNEKYGIHLEYVEWPCLQTGNDSNPTYFPMELCNIVSGQRYIKKLSDAQVREMLTLSCTPPRVRQENILKTVTANGYQSDEFAREFGLDVSNRLTRVDARILPAPELMYHKMNGQLDVCSPKSGSWNMINRKAVNGGNCHSWACLNFSRNRDDVVWNFAYSLANKCRNMGMGFSEEPLYFSRSPPDRCEHALHDVLTNCKKKLTDEKHLQLLLIVLPEASGLYGRIKRICETELGIVSQCCKPKQVHDCKPQYQENVALKINVKVGGRNTQIMKPMNLPMVTDLPTIIFGADVTHPHPGEDTIPSIAAVVASVDWPYVTNYRCLVSAQKHRDEIIHDLYVPPIDPSKSPGGMIRDHLIAFYVTTRQKPSRIIFYRDGVSEGQFNAVLLHEMDAIRKACQTLEQGYLPRVTFVVVQKRHHTRLFPADKNVDRSGNILPGTVVDTTICHPTQFDFYLCSHAGIKGTSRPTHYHVLYDENGFSADHFQILTNNLCYTYARCTRSVSIVPPAYYAHLAAFRARYYMDDGSDALSTTDSGNKRGKEAVVRPIPKIMDIVNKVMFYC